MEFYEKSQRIDVQAHARVGELWLAGRVALIQGDILRTQQGHLLVESSKLLLRANMWHIARGEDATPQSSPESRQLLGGGCDSSIVFGKQG